MGFLLEKAGDKFNLDHLVAIFNHLDDLVFLVERSEDNIFRCVEVNAAYLKAIGLPMEAMKNKRIEEILTGAEAAAATENYNKAIARKQAQSYEENVKIKDHDRTFETTIIPIFLEDQHVCRYILGVSRDISERKRYERALLEAKTELKSVIQHQQAVVLKADKQGKDFIYTLCDGQLIHQLGLTLEEVVGKRPQDLFPEAEAANLIKHFQLCWDSKEKVTLEFSDMKNGKEIYWLTVISPIIENEQTTSLLIYGIDILERKKAEEALLKNEKLALIGEWAAGIGHELRNPLTAIRGFIKFMRENKEAVEDQFLDVIDSELESINQIAGELMVLAKPQVQNFKYINLQQLLDEVIFLFKPQALTAGIDMETNYRSSIALVLGEKYQLKQVFINLVKNAMDALDGHSGGKVSIECWQEGNKWMVKVADNGCGIPKEMINKIGEPFFTTKEKGTGLGLLVSYRIIKNHGGVMVCESETGKGTSFIISFPVYSENGRSI